MIDQTRERVLEEIVRIMGPNIRIAFLKHDYPELKEKPTLDAEFEAEFERREALGALNALQQLADFILR